MIQASQIKPEMPIVCSNNGQFGVVDHMQGSDTIKVKKDGKGQHHFFPLSWVKSVDGKVHVDRPGAQAMKDWSSVAPKDAKTEGKPGATEAPLGADVGVTRGQVTSPGPNDTV